LTDTTGILPDNRLTSNVALKNINNNFVTQTFSAWSSFTGANSAVVYNDTSAPVDGKVWRTLNYSNGNFYIEATADDQSAVVAQFAFIRAGAGLHAGYFAGDGSNLTNLNASNLALGLANPARLGSGTANSSTYLRGDSTWATLPAGLEPFPSGMIVLSAGVPCAIGWTRVTAWDGNFIRLGPGGTGGAASHSHGPGTMAALGGHNHGGQTGPADIIINPNTTLSGDHTHPFSGSIAGTTGAAGGPTSGTDAGGSFTSAYSSHTHDFSAGYSGTTGGGGNHSHGITVTGGGRSSIAAEAAIPLSGVTDAQSNLPPYIDLWLCQKN
jgi:hypothetical protein